MTTLYLNNDFPDVIESETETIATDKRWYDGNENIIRYAYEEETLTYKGEWECQASPLEPGKYLYPDWTREISPMEELGEISEEEEYYFNKEEGKWDKRPSIFTLPVYEKRSGARVETPIDSNRSMYTFKKPINSLCSWNEEQDDWVLDPEKVKNSFLSTSQMFVLEENASNIELKSGKVISGVSSFNDYIVGLNTTPDDGEYCIQNKEGDIIYLSKSELKEAVDILKVKKANILKASAHYQTLSNNITDLESVYEVLDTKKKSSDGFIPTEESVKLLSKLVELLEKKDN